MAENITEYAGVAFSSGIKDGWQVSVTERAESSAEAVANLEATIAVMKDDGYTPFISYTNKAELRDVLPPPAPQASVPTPQMEKDAFPKDAPVGYLGLKPAKLDDINAGENYDVPAQTYSFDGTWVNFYNGEQDAASYYYANKTSAKIFGEMFGWTPDFEDKAPIPGGNVTLYIVGVDSKGTVYQNVKKVT